MFIAKGKNGERILIENAKKGDEYFCPICDGPLTVKAENSLAVSKHFAHKQGSYCLDDWSHDMSEWHRAWQEKFPEKCREFPVEKNGVKHRADIFINNTVIEFQHSPITYEEILARNTFFLSLGYNVVWVFDAMSPSYKIKNKNKDNDCLDPMKCNEDDLCWNRAKSQFKSIIQKGVNVYIQYRTTVSMQQKEYNGKEFDILLLLKELTPKAFKFFKLKDYICKENFLQEYGVNTGFLSIGQIFQATYSQQMSQPKPVIRGWFVFNKPSRNYYRRHKHL